MPQFEGLRPNGRRLDDFRRPEGLYASQGGVKTTLPQDSVAPSPAAQKRQPPQVERASRLRSTLPLGGVISRGQEQKRGKNGGSGGKGIGKLVGWRKYRKWGLRSALILAAIVVLLGGFLIFKGVLKLNKVFKGGGEAASLQSDVKPELLKGEGDGRVNILLIGRDSSSLTDTMIVASIDPVNKDAALVSVPRDLWVTTPGNGSSKINAVHSQAKNRALRSDPKDKDKAEAAGIDALQDVIGQVLGIPIHYYGTIDFEGFKQAVDVVGGIEIDVPAELAVKEQLWDGTTGKNYYLNVPAGKQHFDSTKALYFTRSRHTSVRGDFSRSERQRLFIQALANKVLSAGTYTNPLKVSQLMNAFGDHMSTDLSLSNVLRLAEISRGMDMSKMKSVGLADPPNNFVRTDSVGDQSVVRPTAGFGDYSEIQNYIRNTLKDPYLAKENARIAVLNGTTVPGAASKKAEQLKSYGYNVTVVGDAPSQDYSRTAFVDLTDNKKPFTKSYLEKRLEVKSITNVPIGLQTQDIDFVVIIGQND